MRNLKIRQRVQLLTGSIVVGIALLLTACVCPGHLGKRTTTVTHLKEYPALALYYMGSDSDYHHFLRLNCAKLLTLGEWSVSDRFRLKKSDYSASAELLLTDNRSLWRNYTGESSVSLEEDFVAKDFHNSIPKKDAAR